LQHRLQRIPLALLLLLLPFVSPAQASVFQRTTAPAPETGATVTGSPLPGRGSLPVTAGPRGRLESAPAASFLAVDREAVAAFRAAGGGRLELPEANGEALALELEPYPLLAGGGAISYTDAAGRHAFSPDVSLYRGKVAGEADSWAVFAMGGAGVFGTIERAGRRWSIGPVARADAGTAVQAGPLPAHALSPEGARASGSAPFACGIDDANEASLSAPLPRLPARPGETGPQAPAPGNLRTPFAPGASPGELVATRTVWRIAVDCDYEVWHDKFGGDLTAATSYALTVLGTVSLLYERDLAATLVIPYLNLWTTPADPYSAATPAAQLTQMVGYWGANNAGIVRAAAFLMSGRNLGGGIGLIGGLCSNSNGYALAAMDFNYTYPASTATWDVTVVAHELGHVFGSWHTHSCNWADQGFLPAHTTIDSCFASEGGCAAYPDHLPPAKGTIMSYCFVQFGVADGIRLEFHPLCVQRMRAVMAVSACSTQALPQPPRSPLAAPLANGVRVSWTAGGSPSVLGYEVWRSTSPLDLNPERAGFTPSLQFDDPSLTLHYYRVRTVRAADTSSWSVETSAASACGSNVAAPAAAGLQPGAGLTADLNGDGREDVLFLRRGDNTLGLLLGQGTGSVGDGTFAAPTPIPTQSGTRAIALDDVTGDGILDVLLCAQSPHVVGLHRGNGSAGVPNGTFQPVAAVTVLPLAPVAVLTADTDEDGIDDLLVAAGSTLFTLPGQGSGGVPNGSFGSLRSTSVGMAAQDLIAHDFNADGVLDLAVSGSLGLKVFPGSGYTGKGDGTFNIPSTYPAGASPGRMAVADLNLDGADDIVVADRADTVVRVFLGNRAAGVPDGTFASGVAYGAGPRPGVMRVLDWDRNGLPDLLVVNETAPGAVSVLLGRGDGTLASRVSLAAGGDSTSDVVVGDFDENGALEALAANRAGNNYERLAGSCAGSLSNAVTLVAPNGGEAWLGLDERTVSWTKGAGVMSVDLQLSTNAGTTWRTIARELTGTSWKWTVPNLTTSQARVRVVVHGMPQSSDLSNANFSIAPGAKLGVDGGPVPCAGGAGGCPGGLALLGAWPNPARGELVVGFTLPSTGPPGQGSGEIGRAGSVTLEMVDALGRRVAARDLSAMGAGRHEITLFDRQSVPPGVYLLRLERGAELRLAKVTVVR